MQEIIDQYFVPKTKVECDGYRNYLNLEGVELNTKKYETDGYTGTNFDEVR